MMVNRAASNGFRWTTEWLQKRWSSTGLILMYHRVAEVGSDPWSLCVTPQHFAEHLEVLREYGYPTQMQYLHKAVQNTEHLRRPIAVTFDDGYADNLQNAKPLLEHYDIPATVFVVSGCVDQEREFWWDELERVFLQPGTLPGTLHLTLNNNPYQWQLGDTVDYSDDTYRLNPFWRTQQRNEPNPRHTIFHALYKLLQPLCQSEQQKVLDELMVWSGVDSVCRPTHRSLSAAELLALSDGKLIEIGAHTATHPLLSSLPGALQQDEIEQSKARLEEIMGIQLCSFSYPYGDYTEGTVGIVKNAGFTSACSTNEDSVWRRSDCFQLPRFAVQNWDGEQFERKLSRWFRS